jgi:serine/threonine protein kinase
VDPNAGVLSSGSVLDARYRIERVVGAGGSAMVYAATDVIFGDPVAVKVLRPLEGVSEERHADALAQLEAEAKLLVRLDHPGIVRTLGQGTVAGLPYLVVEWCSAGSLKDMLAGRERSGYAAMSVAEAWPLMRDATRAIAHAHEAGVLHRDIKPANLMLVTGGGKWSARVIDFGIGRLYEATASRTGETSTRSRPAFTPAYASPEQIAGLRSGPWTDVHALALVFVEMLVGDMPYARSASAFVGAVAAERPTPATFGVDAGAFEPVLARALALRRDQRFASAGELAEAFERAAHS